MRWRSFGLDSTSVGRDFANDRRMAEMLATFPTAITGPDGVVYRVRACGSVATDGLWHAWLEFTPLAGGVSVCSSRETTQPNRTDAEYWAAGLTPVYLDGALRRALAAPPANVSPHREPVSFEPPSAPVRRPPSGIRESALDPFSVYAKGEQLLRRQLGALSQWHLVNIAVAHELADEDIAALNQRPSAYLIELIVRGVRDRQHAIER